MRISLYPKQPRPWQVVGMTICYLFIVAILLVMAHGLHFIRLPFIQ